MCVFRDRTGPKHAIFARSLASLASHLDNSFEKPLVEDQQLSERVRDAGNLSNLKGIWISLQPVDRSLQQPLESTVRLEPHDVRSCVDGLRKRSEDVCEVDWIQVLEVVARENQHARNIVELLARCNIG